MVNIRFTPPTPQKATPSELRPGDWFAFEDQSGIGYLLHDSDRLIIFPATGARIPWILVNKMNIAAQTVLRIPAPTIEVRF